MWGAGGVDVERGGDRDLARSGVSGLGRCIGGGGVVFWGSPCVFPMSSQVLVLGNIELRLAARCFCNPEVRSVGREPRGSLPPSL